MVNIYLVIDLLTIKCLVIGGMEGVKYAEYELDLDPGSLLFLYSDGVPEAIFKVLTQTPPYIPPKTGVE